MSAPVDAQPIRHFQMVFHEHVNKGIFLPLGDAYHFYQWMVANQYWSAAAEHYDHVGHWIRRGLIVSRFSTYDEFAQLAKISTKTVARQLSRIEECGFAVVLQEGGFVRGDKGRAPFVVAIGAWNRAPDGSRIPHYVGWTNALGGQNGHITIDELSAHVANLEERGGKAREQLSEARAKWAAMQEAYIAEEFPGKTNLSNREKKEMKSPGKTNLSDRGKTELSSRGKTTLSSVNLDGDTQIATTEILDSSLRSESFASPIGNAAPKLRRKLPSGLPTKKPEAPKEEAKVEGGDERVETKAEAIKRAGGFPAYMNAKVEQRKAELSALPKAPSKLPSSTTQVSPIAPPSSAPPPSDAAAETLPRGAKSKKAKSEPKYGKELVNAMFDALVQTCYPNGGLTEANRKRAGKDGATLLDAGYKPEDVQSIYAYLIKDAYWKDKTISTGVISSQAVNWANSKAKVKPDTGNVRANRLHAEQQAKPKSAEDEELIRQVREMQAQFHLNNGGK